MTLLIHVLGNRDELSFYGIFICEKIIFKAMMYFYLIKKKIKNSDCKMSDFFSFFIFFNFFLPETQLISIVAYVKLFSNLLNKA